MTPNVWTWTIPIGRAWWQNIKLWCKMWNVWIHFPSPPVKDVSITRNPVWWAEAVPESRWCFVWSQTGQDCTALKQLEDSFAVREASQGAGGAPVIHGRMYSGGRGSESSMDATRNSDTLAPHRHLLASPFCVLFRLHTFVKTNTCMHKHKVTGKYYIRLSTIWYC